MRKKIWGAASLGDPSTRVSGADGVNQPGGVVVMNRECKKSWFDYTYQRMIGMVAAVFVDGSLKELNVDRDVCTKQYTPRHGNHRVSVSDISVHDHTLEVPIITVLHGAFTLSGTAYVTCNVRADSKEAVEYFNHLLNSDHASFYPNYSSTETAWIMTEADMDDYFAPYIQNVVKDLLVHERIIYDNMDLIRQKFLHAIRHEPVFAHMNIISVDLRLEFSEWDRVCRCQEEAEIRDKLKEFEEE